MIRLLNIQGITQEDRAGQFVAGGFGDRATFFRRLKKLKAIQTEPMPERIIVPTGGKKSPGKRRAVLTA